MLSLRQAVLKIKKVLYMPKADPTDRPKDDLFQPTDHTNAVNITHDKLTEEQIGGGQGQSYNIDPGPRK